MIIDSKVVTRDFLSLADIFKAQTLHIHKLAKVIIIGEYKNLVLASFQIVSPSLKRLNDF